MVHIFNDFCLLYFVSKDLEKQQLSEKQYHILGMKMKHQKQL